LSGGRNHPGVNEVRNLYSRDANARARCQHKHRLSRTDAGAANQHVPCRQKDERHGRRLIELEAVGNRNYVYSRHSDKFAIATVYAVAKHGEFGAMILQSGDAFHAMIAEVHRREDHALARIEASYIFAGLDDFSRNIAAQDVRQVDARETLADPNIKMVQGASSDANKHLI